VILSLYSNNLSPSLFFLLFFSLSFSLFPSLGAARALVYLRWAHAAAPDVAHTRRNALHVAARHNQPKAIEALIKEFKVDKESRTTTGETPLHVAAEHNAAAAVKALLAAGANPHAENM